MKRKVALSLSLTSALLLAGCAGGGGAGGFDIVKFLQNPFVMIIIGLFIVYWMMKHSR